MSKRKVSEIITIVPEKVFAIRSTKTPKTLKDKILDLVSKEDKFVGLATIKKILAENYDVAESSANNTKINKTLKVLTEEERDDFGKVGRSYHGGIHSRGFIEHSEQQAAEAAEAAEFAAHEDDMKCPFCLTWVNEERCWKGEDSIIRGSKYLCSNCDKTFWSWISDGYRIGRKIEYKYSADYV